MSNFKQQLFQFSASEQLKLLVSEYSKKFEPKKDDRFHIDRITYEFGLPNATDLGIQFEISSKIPQDELTDPASRRRYFSEVRKLATKDGKRPSAVEMENIARELEGDEVKSRDYVKLRFDLSEEELYNEKVIIQKAEEYRNSAETKTPPSYSGVQTLEGNLLIDEVGSSFYQCARNSMDRLIEANLEVSKKIKQLRSAARSSNETSAAAKGKQAAGAKKRPSTSSRSAKSVRTGTRLTTKVSRNGKPKKATSPKKSTTLSKPPAKRKTATAAKSRRAAKSKPTSTKSKVRSKSKSTTLGKKSSSRSTARKRPGAKAASAKKR